LRGSEGDEEEEEGAGKKRKEASRGGAIKLHRC
jgi:hypothetical protein